MAAGESQSAIFNLLNEVAVEIHAEVSWARLLSVLAYRWLRQVDWDRLQYQLNIAYITRIGARDYNAVDALMAAVDVVMANYMKV